MEAIAKLNNVPIAPRKMRMVVDLIRGEKVGRALSILKFQSKSGAPLVEKLLLSAVANWENKFPDAPLEDADLFIKEIYVNGGRTLKRFRPAPQGRAHRIRKRSNHVFVKIAAGNQNLAEEMEDVVEAEEVETTSENKD